jgi:hypothetical protein
MNFKYLSLSLFLCIFGVTTDCFASHPFPHKAKKTEKVKCSGSQAAVCLATVSLLVASPVIIKECCDGLARLHDESAIPASSAIVAHEKLPKPTASLHKTRIKTKKPVQQPRPHAAHSSPKMHRTHSIKSSLTE